MSTYLNSNDVINGGEGVAYAKIGENNEELFYAKSIQATAEKSKYDVTPIGRRVTGHKSGRINITGTMTLYYLSPLFRRMLYEYKESGRDSYFNMVVENNDPASAAGKQTILLIGVNLDSVILGQLDGTAEDALEEEVPFTAEDWTPLNSFTTI